ncbi:hypothetical protein K474DRAFT_1655495 [Panus rudis PR-1116 ss-1]|nr:hypothetical protein K474DRAFT_1655495 [Panus rudis PR-1116 ss-1]
MLLNAAHATQTIDIQANGSSLQITTTKKNASPQAVRSRKSSSTIRNRSGPRRTVGVVAKLAKRGYRPDLRPVSMSLCSAWIIVSRVIWVFGAMQNNRCVPDAVLCPLCTI